MTRVNSNRSITRRRIETTAAIGYCRTLQLQKDTIAHPKCELWYSGEYSVDKLYKLTNCSLRFVNGSASTIDTRRNKRPCNQQPPLDIRVYNLAESFRVFTRSFISQRFNLPQRHCFFHAKHYDGKTIVFLSYILNAFQYTTTRVWHMQIFFNFWKILFCQ